MLRRTARRSPSAASAPVFARMPSTCFLTVCWLSKQHNDFDYVIHRYLRALGFGLSDGGRFFGRIRVLESEILRDRVAGFLVINARLRVTVRVTTRASCCR